MNSITKWLVISGAAGFIALTPAPLFAQPSGAPLPAPENPLKPEKNPPGDIPDNQVFIEYHSPLGFSIKVPEGWARRQAADTVTFSDKYNTIELAAVPHPELLTASSAKQKEISELEKSGKAVRVSNIKAAKLPSGSASVVS